MGKIFGKTLICIYMAFMAKSTAVLVVFLIYVPFLIGAEIYKYREDNREYNKYLAEQKAKV